MLDEEELFRQKHLRSYKAQLIKASKKLGLPLTNKNLPVLAQEVRGAQKPTELRSKKKSKTNTVSIG